MPVTHTCTGCGSAFVTNNAAPQDVSVFCKDCFRSNLNRDGQEILVDYLHFGIASRAISAQLIMDQYRKLDISPLRKFLSVKLFEELMLATEDLVILYFAIRDRKTKPTVETLMTFDVNPRTTDEWVNELTNLSDEEILENLGLMNSGNINYQHPPLDDKTMRHLLVKSLEIMRVAATNRTSENRLLVRGLNKIKHGFIVLEGQQFILKETPDPELTATIVIADREFGRLQLMGTDASETAMSKQLETVEAYRLAAEGLLKAHLLSTGCDPTKI